MDLYYSPMACSLAARIICLEAGLAVTMRRADLVTKRTDGPERELLALNPMGKVPALVCDDGLVLTENVAVLLFLGDRAPPERGLVPAEGTRARYEVVRWLSFVATEVHRRVLAPIYTPGSPPEVVKQVARESASQPLAVLDAHLRDRDVLVGETFTVADAYLVWALALVPAPRCGVSLAPYASVAAYLRRHRARESVTTAMRLEYEEYSAAT